MKLKRFLAMTMAGALTLGALAGCGGGSSNASGSGAAAGGNSDVKVGYVNLADTDVFCMTREKAFVAAAEAKGWSVECTDGNNDSQKQIDQSKSFIAKGVTALVLVPCDAAGCVPIAEEANNAGVPLIVFGNNLTGTDAEYTFIGSPHTVSGQMEGEYMAEVLPENAKVCYLAGTAGLDHAAMRRDGTHEALEAAGRTDVEFLDDQDGDYVKDEGMRITQAWIQKYSDGKGGVQFNAIISANDQMALGAVEALKGANIPVGTGEGEVIVCGIDGSDEGLQAVKDGYMGLSVLQDAPGQGKAAVDAIQTLLDGGTPDAEINVDYIPVTADNIDEYIDYNKA